MKSTKSLIAELIDEEILSHLHLHETNDEFIQRICELCIDELERNRKYSPRGFGADVISEIEMEVTEVFRMKTYGYYNLQDYRNSQLRKRIS
jgi:hypothetical protein